jgi:hypothetical protein
MVSHEEVRRQRMAKLQRTFEEAKDKDLLIDEEQLIAQCCLEWGASRRTVLEYIKIVRTAHGY